ncbi:hypothetical protein DFH28DRAFT_1066272 [Melampsora americana]|nr:hypothetical protein DFH28DRAFT_1066272 [Melampsora americana]
MARPQYPHPDHPHFQRRSNVGNHNHHPGQHPNRPPGPNMASQNHQHLSGDAAYQPSSNNVPRDHQSPQIDSSIVKRLESIVNDQEGGLESQITNTQTTNNPSTGTDPGVAQSQRADPEAIHPRKQGPGKKARPAAKRSKTTNQPDDAPILEAFDIQQTTNKSAVELRFLAKKYATVGMSEVTLNVVLKFHDEMQTMIAIKALELGTTVSVIEQIFGKYIGTRQMSAWNCFLRSNTAQGIFKAASGISSGEAMKRLGATWANMDQDEKQIYKDLAGKVNNGTDTPNINNSNNKTLDKQLDVMDVGSQSRDNILHPCSNTLINARCLKKYKENAIRLLDLTLARCVLVARSNLFELAIIAVSTHSGKYNFQLTQNTAEIDKQIQFMYASDGINNFPAQLQSYVLGKTTTNLAVDTASQFSILHHETTLLSKWPWSNCDKVLADAGFQLKLLPGARSEEQTFKTPSARSNHTKLLAIDSDLKEKLIQLLPIQRSNTEIQVDQNITHQLNETPQQWIVNDVNPLLVLDSSSLDPSLL